LEEKSEEGGRWRKKADRQTERLADDRPTDRQGLQSENDKKTNRQIGLTVGEGRERKTDRHTHRETYGQGDRQTN